MFLLKLAVVNSNSCLTQLLPQTLLTNARNADEIVKKKFSDNEGAIELLSKDEVTILYIIL